MEGFLTFSVSGTSVSYLFCYPIPVVPSSLLRSSHTVSRGISRHIPCYGVFRNVTEFTPALLPVPKSCNDKYKKDVLVEKSVVPFDVT